MRTISAENMDDDALAIELDGLEKHEKAGTLGSIALRRLKMVRREFNRRIDPEVRGES